MAGQMFALGAESLEVSAGCPDFREADVVDVLLDEVVAKGQAAQNIAVAADAEVVPGLVGVELRRGVPHRQDDGLVLRPLVDVRMPAERAQVSGPGHQGGAHVLYAHAPVGVGGRVDVDYSAVVDWHIYRVF